MKLETFTEKINEIMFSETPEIIDKLIKKLYNDVKTNFIKPKKMIGVIALSLEDFSEWRKESKLIEIEPGTTKKAITKNKIYIAICNRNHLISKQLDELIETKNGKLNKGYDKIKNDFQNIYHASPNKMI